MIPDRQVACEFNLKLFASKFAKLTINYVSFKKKLIFVSLKKFDWNVTDRKSGISIVEK